MGMEGLDRLVTACFSGYRAQKFPFPLISGTPEFDALVSRLDAAVEAALDNGYERFYCGAAQGFDLVAAEAVLRLREKERGVRLLCAVPFPGQANGWESGWRERYNRVIERCDAVETISSVYSRGCYQLRNRHMVDRSGRLICYFDGRPGGTAWTVRYAMKNALEIVNLCEKRGEGF